MLTDEQRQQCVNQFRALFHAELDGDAVFIEAKHKASGESVLLACIKREIIVPPRVLGGEASVAEQVIPIFQFVDPSGPNPYEAPDGIEDIPATSIVLPAGGVAVLRDASDGPAQG